MRKMLGAMASLAISAMLLPQRSAAGQYPFQPESRVPRAGIRDRQPRARKTVAPPSAHQVAIDRLTNWQRHQWVKAGRPKDRLAAFAMLLHPKHGPKRSPGRTA